FDAVARYEEIVALPVRGIGLDFVHGREGNLQALRQHGFPGGKTLAAGVVDGRNIWRSELPAVQAFIGEIAGLLADDSALIIQPSCSLLHVPVSAQGEDGLPGVLKDALAFAEEKLDESAALRQALHGENPA
ncbi:5-methyltetrahydropteroyltriglutamate--homocysteine S-methyltransferase, partial [Clostridium perfringens]